MIMYTLLIPRNQSVRERKTGRNGPFWKSFWEKKVSEDPQTYQRQYQNRLNRLNRSVSSITARQNDPERRYYLRAKLDAKATSKSKEPTELWKESGVKVVETRDDGSVTLSGRAADFQKLASFIESSNFDIASQTEGVSKQVNLAREVYSVTAFSTPDKRTSREIQELLASNSNERVACILNVYFDRGVGEYDELYEVLANKIGRDNIHKIDTRLFISNMSFGAHLNAEEIQSILDDDGCDFISLIKKSPVYGTQRTTPNANTNALQIGRLVTNEQVVVLDTGIDEPVINRFVSQRENLLPPGGTADKGHGTSVASRILFGENIFAGTTGPLLPAARLIDAQVIPRDRHGDLFVEDEKLREAIELLVRRYGNQSSIFNLSLSAEKGVDDTEEVSDTTEMIDTFANEKDILFVCATGNQKGNFPLGYRQIFNTAGVDCHIASPADAINALSVGAIATVADANSICPTPNLPSPFTRKGGIRNDIKKPEVVASGGNIQTDPTHRYADAHLAISHRTYGVEAIDPGGFHKTVGTSFSAPLITRASACLLDYLKKSNLAAQLGGFANNKANLVKALLIHSTSRVTQPPVPTDGLKRAYGFGQTNFESVLRDNDDQVTVVYADRVSFLDKKQKIVVALPEFLRGKPVEFTFTFVYNPPVNKNFKEYKMIELQPSIGFIQPVLDDEGNPTEKTKIKGSNPEASWDNYRSKHFNTFHFKKHRARLTDLNFQVLVQMLVSSRLLEENEGNEGNISQNYAFALTVKDLSASGQLRTEILNSNQFVELVENVVAVEA